MKTIILFVFLILTAVSVFAEEISISAKLSTPEITLEEITVPIELEYKFPLDMYQSYNKDFFYFTVEGIEGLVQDSITYPEGELKNGITEYFGKTVLSSVLHLPANSPSGSYTLSIIAAYQLCSVNGMCYFPEEERIVVEFEL